MGRTRAAKAKGANGSQEQAAGKKRGRKQITQADDGSQPAAEAGRESVTQFLNGLAAALLARSKGAKKWKVEAVGAALERAVASLPDGPAKQLLHASLNSYAAELHQKLTARAAEGPEDAAAQEAKPAKAAKRAKTGQQQQQRALSVGDSWALLFDSTYDEARQLCLEGRLPPSIAPQALTAARCPPPTHVLGRALGLPPAPAGPGSPAPAALARADEAVGLCSALASLADSAEEGLACFGPLAEWLFQAAGAMQEPAWFRQEPSAPQRWRQLGAVAARLLCSMELLLQQQSQQQRQLGSGEGSGWMLKVAGAERDSGAATLAAAHAAMLRAMCRDITAQLLQGAPVERLGKGKAGAGGSGSGSGNEDLAGLVAQAAADLRRLAPFGAPGLVELMAGIPPGSIEASTEGARGFLCLQQALARQPAAGPQEFLLRLGVARRAADACTAAGGALARRGQEALAAAARAAAPMELVEGLRRQPPSTVVAAALAAAESGGQEALSAYLLREPSLKVLLALARMLGGAEGEALGGPLRGKQMASGGEAGEAEGGAGDGADELLFYVSTEADETMFGRDWAADEESEDEGEEGEGDGKKGVRLGELSDDEEEGNAKGGSEEESSEDEGDE